jgi:hypothetical protein
MSWHLSEKESTSVLSLPDDMRYSYCLKRIADWEEIWSLRNRDGWVLMRTPDGFETVPIWPHSDYAAKCIKDEWADCEPASISLTAWMDRWLPGLHEDGRQIAVFPTPADSGVTVEAKRLASDLAEECAKYE